MHTRYDLCYDPLRPSMAETVIFVLLVLVFGAICLGCGFLAAEAWLRDPGASPVAVDARDC